MLTLDNNIACDETHIANSWDSPGLLGNYWLDHTYSPYLAPAPVQSYELYPAQILVDIQKRGMLNWKRATRFQKKGYD